MNTSPSAPSPLSLSPSPSPSLEGSIDCTVRGFLLLIAINRPARRNGLLHLLTGDEFGSAEALRLNFVHKVVPAGQALDEAPRIADVIAAQVPLAVVATRQNARKALEHGPLPAMQDFIAVQQSLSRSEHAAEGVRSFVEKRPAKFQRR